VHRPEWLSRLPHPSVNAMLEDREGALWIGTGFGRQGGVLRIRDNALSVLTKADGLPGEMVRTLWQDRLGRIWAGTEYDGAVYPTPAGWHLLTPDIGLAGWEVKAIAEDRDAQLWLGTENGVTRMPFPGASP
jgi:ligand-binding sensor domain-containing protein